MVLYFNLLGVQLHKEFEHISRGRDVTQRIGTFTFYMFLKINKLQVKKNVSQSLQQNSYVIWGGLQHHGLTGRKKLIS